MEHPLFAFLGNPNAFLDRIFEYLAAQKMNAAHWEMDHICYRVETLDRYEALKKQIGSIGHLLIESEIGGRAIATFKLNQAFTYKNRSIDCLELPAPKTGSFYKEGFEHVEFVIDQNFENFIQQYPNLNFITKDLKKAINKGVTLKETDFSIKFHHQSLEKVIELEKEIGVIDEK
jgi:predicted metalloenzyme YecM